MQVHELKCWPEFYNAVVRGEKTFEYRLNDRNYQRGDILILRKFRPTTGEYATDKKGRPVECAVKVTYIVTEAPGLPEGYCIMGVKVL